MFVPYGTDAPIYHWPYATVALIFLMIVIYPVQMSLPGEEVSRPPISEMADYEFEELEEILRIQAKPGWYDYALSHGDGLHPIQWLTSFLMHAGFGHLMGNMLFLWVFGIVIEGKIGPWMFTAVFFAMGIFQNMTEQMLFLGTPDVPSLGASSVIYGLMVMSMIWAPRDNILSFTVILFTPFLFKVPILILAFLYLFFDFGTMMFSGFQLGTAMLHVMGGVVGLIPALMFLKLNWVDCEHHDIFSLIRDAAGKELKPRVKTRRELEQEKQGMLDQKEEQQKKSEVFQKSIDAHLQAGNVEAAVKLMTNFKRRGGNVAWNKNQLIKVIRLYQSASNWQQVISFSNQYLQRFSENANAVRLNLSKVLLLQRQSPRKALQQLQLLDQPSLTEKQKQVVGQIEKHARKELDQGTLELGD